MSDASAANPDHVRLQSGDPVGCWRGLPKHDWLVSFAAQAVSLKAPESHFSMNVAKTCKVHHGDVDCPAEKNKRGAMSGRASMRYRKQLQ